MEKIPAGTGILLKEQPAERVLVMEEQKKPEAFGPLRGRNFALLFGGQTISVVGDALYLVALP